MAETSSFSGNVTVQGDLTVRGDIHPVLARDRLEQNSGQIYVQKLTDLRVVDALHTNLPGTAAGDDLELTGGTFGTNSPTVQTGDVASSNTTRYARMLMELPPEYVAGETVTIRCFAGMKTTISDTTATIDIECYESDKEEGIGSDLCVTSAISINSLTFANADFTITATALSPGDVLDVRVTIAVNDGATGTAVIGVLGSLELLLDIKG